ncbi:MAG: hypothetical protein SFW65_04500 [Alphaproteobacteria bacterium]|nr:hypothetical protein [Alphaproteobacteria bacterium]
MGTTYSAPDHQGYVNITFADGRQARALGIPDPSTNRLSVRLEYPNANGNGGTMTFDGRGTHLTTPNGVLPQTFARDMHEVLGADYFKNQYLSRSYPDNQGAIAAAADISRAQIMDNYLRPKKGLAP